MNIGNLFNALNELDTEIKEAFISLKLILDSVEGNEEKERYSLSRRFISIARSCQRLEVILDLPVSTMEELTSSVSTSEMDVFPLREFVKMKIRIKFNAMRNNLKKEDLIRYLQEAKTALCYVLTQFNAIKDIGVELENMYA